MKKIILLSLILNIIPLTVIGGDCIQEYRDSLKNKNSKYEGDIKVYTNSNLTILTSITAKPHRMNYDMFEEDIIKAVEFKIDPENQEEIRPIVLEQIYNAAYEKYSDVTFQLIQEIILDGFFDKRFCSIFGRSRVPRIQRYVLNQLEKKENTGSVYERNPAANDLDEINKAQSKAIKTQNDEVGKPSESQVIGQ